MRLAEEKRLRLEDLEPEDGQRTPPLSAEYGPLNAEGPPRVVARPGAGQIGSQLQTVFFLFDRAIRNPDDIGIETYERMYVTDETFSAAVDFVIMAVLSRLGRYEHPDQRIAEFINENLAEMQGSFVGACAEILSAIWAGHSVTEIVLQPVGSQVRLERLVTYHPATILYRLDDHGQLMRDGILQYRWWAGTPVKIPTRKVIHYVHNGRFGNSYGSSAGRRVYKNWLLKDALLRMWATALDRFGTPLLAAIVPDMMVEDPETQEEISALDYVMKVLGNIQNQTVLGLHRGADIKALTQGGSGVGEAFDKAIAYLNKVIMRGVLLPSLLLEEGRKGGSYALGQKHFDAFWMMIDSIFRHLTDVLVDQLVRLLVELNFGPQRDYGRFEDKSRAPDAQLMMALGQAFNALTQSGYITPEAEEDWNYVRQAAGFPARPRGEVDRLARIAVTESAYLRGGEEGDGGDGRAVGSDDEGAA